MDADTLSMLAGAVLSLAFSYVPGLSSWYDPLAAEYKRLVMLGLLVLVAGAAFALACAGLAADLGLALTCDRQNAVGLVRALVLAIAANQGVFKLTRKP